MLVHTNYSPNTIYRVTKVTEGCTCPDFVARINLGEEAPRSRPHCHLSCETLDGKGGFYLNGYDENGRNVWRNEDVLSVCAEETLLLIVACGL